MKPRHFTVIVALALIATACKTAAGGPGSRTWIDAPRDGSTLPLGPVIVMSHTTSNGSPIEAALLVNGASVRTDNLTGEDGDLLSLSQVWEPQANGNYTLQVITDDGSGTQGQSNFVRIEIGEILDTPTAVPAEPEEPIEPPTPTPTPVEEEPPQPLLTFNLNAFCRIGPGTAYPDAGSFNKDDQVLIDGRNDEDPRWWYVHKPDSKDHCWVSFIVGDTTGPVEAVPLQAYAPPPEPAEEKPAGPNCAAIVNDKTCISTAGCVWTKAQVCAPQ
jgi:hypothetical protein